MSKLAIVVEDKVRLGNQLVGGLEDRGFEAYLATSAEETRRLLDQLNRCPDIVTLDQNLGGEIDGPKVGREIRDRFRKNPPDAIIYSGYFEPKYVRGGFNQNVAVYLQKGVDDWEAVMDHARVLAARRIFRTNTAERSQDFQKLARELRSVTAVSFEAVRHYLVPVLLEMLGTRLLVIVGDESTARGYGNLNTAGGPILYHGLLNACVGLDTTEPFILGEESFFAEFHRMVPDVAESLREVVFLNLYQGPRLSIVLGFLRDEDDPFGADPVQVAGIMSNFFRADLVEHFLFSVQVTAEHEISKQELLGATAHFCHYVGHRQLDTFHAAVELNELNVGAVHLPKIQTMGRDLCSLGEMLQMMQKESGPLAGADVAFLIRETWKGIANAAFSGNFTLEGSEIAMIRRDRIHLACKRILGWLAARMPLTEDVEPWITVRCCRKGTRVKIAFQDRSPRLDEEIRKRLFLPFAADNQHENLQQWLALFSARVLVESIPGGRLVEATEKLKPDEPGHLFEMYLPAEQAQVEAGGKR